MKIMIIIGYSCGCLAHIGSADSSVAGHQLRVPIEPPSPHGFSYPSITETAGAFGDRATRHRQAGTGGLTWFACFGGQGVSDNEVFTRRDNTTRKPPSGEMTNSLIGQAFVFKRLLGY